MITGVSAVSFRGVPKLGSKQVQKAQKIAGEVWISGVKQFSGGAALKYTINPITKDVHIGVNKELLQKIDPDLIGLRLTVPGAYVEKHPEFYTEKGFIAYIKGREKASWVDVTGETL